MLLGCFKVCLRLGHDTNEETDQATVVAGTPSQTPEPKFVVDANGEIIGIDNSGSKYAVDKPIELRTTPYEERLEKMIQAEEEARKKRSGAARELFPDASGPSGVSF